MKPFNIILQCAASAVILSAGNAYAADGHRADSHQPMVLNPAKATMPAAPAKPVMSDHSVHKALPDKNTRRKISKNAMAPPPAPSVPEGLKLGQKAQPQPKMKLAKSSHSQPTPRTPHWGYSGAGGPAKWGTIEPAFKTCSTGHRQSPIDIKQAEAGQLEPLRFHYKVSLIELVNNGHTIQANYGKGSYITVGAERYELIQFHFHTPSEHRVVGRSFPMEIHFVHRNKRGRLAVVGVLAAFGDNNLAAREIWDRLPARAHSKSPDTRALINARDLLPDDASHFRYSGSLTTPPCSEQVSWMVLQKPVQFSEAQIARLHRIIGMNSRPAQVRNSRYLLQSVGS